MTRIPHKYPPPLQQRTPGPSFAPSGSSSAPSDYSRLMQELLFFLKPYVDHTGTAFDLTHLHAGTFEEFKEFLVDQAGADDHKSFRNPWADLLHDGTVRSGAMREGECDELLRLLYQYLKDPKSLTQNAPQLPRAKVIYKKFKEDFIRAEGYIATSADAFVGNHFSTNEGRKLISDTLRDTYDPAIKAAIIRAVESAGKGEVADSLIARAKEHVSIMDWWNLLSGKRGLEEGEKDALNIISSADEIYAKKDTADDPSSPANKDLDMGKNRLQLYRSMSASQKGKWDMASQIRGMLADLSLFAADDANWDADAWTGESPCVDAIGFARNRLRDVARELLRQSTSVDSDADLDALNKKIQEFVHGYVTISASGEKIRIKEFFSKMKKAYRRAFDGLAQTSDEIMHAREMGESFIKPAAPITPKILSAENDAGKNQLAFGLMQLKARLWYNFKQHGALSQGISIVAERAGIGNIVKIRQANAELDQLIGRLVSAKDAAAVEKAVDDLFTLLKKGNALYEAIAAASVDGVEATINLVQTMIVQAGLSAVTGGVSALARLATLKNAAAGAEVAATTTTATARGVAAVAGAASGSRFASRFAGYAKEAMLESPKAFAMGAGLTLSENVIGKIAHQAGREDDSIGSYAKDMAATGVSMVVTAWLPISKNVENGLLKNMGGRYRPARTFGGLTDKARGLIRSGKFFSADTFGEILEEAADNYLRAAFDGDWNSVSISQMDELVSVCTMGGGFKAGEMKEIISGAHKKAHAPEYDAENRVADAERLLKRELNTDQKKAIIEAHYVGEGEIGRDGKRPATIGNYTDAQLRQKAKILKDAGFDNNNDRRILIEAGVVGKEFEDGQTYTRKHWREMPAAAIDAAFAAGRERLGSQDADGQRRTLEALYPIVACADAAKNIEPLLGEVLKIDPRGSPKLLDAYLLILSIGAPRVGEEFRFQTANRVLGLAEGADQKMADKIFGYAGTNFADWTTLPEAKFDAICDRFITLVGHKDFEIAGPSRKVLQSNWDQIPYMAQHRFVSRLVEAHCEMMDTEEIGHAASALHEFAHFVKPDEATILAETYLASIGSGKTQGLNEKLKIVAKLADLSGEHAPAVFERLVGVSEGLPQEKMTSIGDAFDSLTLNPDQAARLSDVHLRAIESGHTQNLPPTIRLLDRLIATTKDRQMALFMRLVAIVEMLPLNDQPMHLESPAFQSIDEVRAVIEDAKSPMVAREFLKATCKLADGLTCPGDADVDGLISTYRKTMPILLAGLETCNWRVPIPERFCKLPSAQRERFLKGISDAFFDSCTDETYVPTNLSPFQGVPNEIRVPLARHLAERFARLGETVQLRYGGEVAGTWMRGMASSLPLAGRFCIARHIEGDANGVAPFIADSDQDELIAHLRDRAANGSFTDREFAAKCLAREDLKMDHRERLDLALSLIHDESDVASPIISHATVFSAIWVSFKSRVDVAERYRCETPARRRALSLCLSSFISALAQEERQPAIADLMAYAGRGAKELGVAMGTLVGLSGPSYEHLDGDIRVVRRLNEAQIKDVLATVRRCGELDWKNVQHYTDLLGVLPPEDARAEHAALVDRLAHGETRPNYLVVERLIKAHNSSGPDEEFLFCRELLKMAALPARESSWGEDMYYQRTLTEVEAYVERHMDAVDPKNAGILALGVVDLWVEDGDQRRVGEAADKLSGWLGSGKLKDADPEAINKAALGLFSVIPKMIASDDSTSENAAALIKSYFACGAWTAAGQEQKVDRFAPMLAKLAVVIKDKDALTAILNMAMPSVDARAGHAAEQQVRAKFKDEFEKESAKLSGSDAKDCRSKLTNAARGSDRVAEFYELIFILSEKSLQNFWEDTWTAACANNIPAGAKVPIRDFAIRKYDTLSLADRAKVLFIIVSATGLADGDTRTFLLSKIGPLLENLDGEQSEFNERAGHLVDAIHTLYVRSDVQEPAITQFYFSLGANSREFVRRLWVMTEAAHQQEKMDPAVVREILARRDTTSLALFYALVSDAHRHFGIGGEVWLDLECECAVHPDPFVREKMLKALLNDAPSRERARAVILEARFDPDPTVREAAVDAMETLREAKKLSAAEEAAVFADLPLLFADSVEGIRLKANSLFKQMLYQLDAPAFAESLASLAGNLPSLPSSARQRILKAIGMEIIREGRITDGNREEVVTGIIERLPDIAEPVRANLNRIVRETVMGQDLDSMRRLARVVVFAHTDPSFMTLFTRYFEAPLPVNGALENRVGAILGVFDLLANLSPSLFITYAGDVLAGGLEPRAALTYVLYDLTKNIGARIGLPAPEAMAFREHLSINYRAWYARDFINLITIMSGYLSPEGRGALRELVSMLTRAEVVDGTFMVEERYSRLFDYFATEFVDRYKQNWEKTKERPNGNGRIADAGGEAVAAQIPDGLRTELGRHFGMEFRDDDSAATFEGRIYDNLARGGEDPSPHADLVSLLSRVMNAVSHSRMPAQEDVEEIKRRLARFESPEKLGFASAGDATEFLANLDTLLARDGKKEKKRVDDKLTVRITDDPVAMLRMGMEPTLSCQRAHERTGSNEDGQLLTRLINGQFKLAQVFVNGELAGRAVIELAKDRDGKPILLVERFYDNGRLGEADKRVFADGICEYAKEALDLDEAEVVISEKFEKRNIERAAGAGEVPHETKVYRDTFAGLGQLERISYTDAAETGAGGARTAVPAIQKSAEPLKAVAKFATGKPPGQRVLKRDGEEYKTLAFVGGVYASTSPQVPGLYNAAGTRIDGTGNAPRAIRTGDGREYFFHEGRVSRVLYSRDRSQTFITDEGFTNVRRLVRGPSGEFVRNEVTGGWEHDVTEGLLYGATGKPSGYTIGSTGFEPFFRTRDGLTYLEAATEAAGDVKRVIVLDGDGNRVQTATHAAWNDRREIIADRGNKREIIVFDGRAYAVMRRDGEGVRHALDVAEGTSSGRSEKLVAFKEGPEGEVLLASSEG